MKKLIFAILFAGFSSLTIQAQIEDSIFTDDLSDEPEMEWSAMKTESLSLSASMPKIKVSIQPREGEDIVYEPVAGWIGNQQKQAQVSVKITVRNEGDKAIDWNKVVFKYKQGNSTKSKSFSLDKSISANSSASWQNSRKYHEEGNVLYLTSPLPSSLTIELYFKNFPAPVVVSKKIKPYAKSFGLPFKDSDLDENEHWYSSSTHGGGSQVFAYDMVVLGYANGNWSSKLPGKSGSENNHHRVWGKPVYAMADGVVDEFENNDPNNAKPGERAPGSGGGGNCFKIIHSDVIALYAHMQKGTLNPEFLKKGAIVKKGDFLGLAGNSGSSSGPHLHVHIAKVGGEGFRPLLFNEGYTIGKEYYPSPGATESWSELEKLGIPGFAHKRSFISPSKYHPYGDVLVEHPNGKHGKFLGVWKDKSEDDFLLLGATWEEFTKRWKDLSENKKLRLADLDVVVTGNKIHYNGVFQKGSGKYALYQYDNWGAFTKKWDELSKAGYRLTDIETFKSGNNRYYVGAFKEGRGKYALYQYDNWSAFTKKWDELSKDGYRLIDVETYKSGDNQHYIGVFEEGQGKYALYQYDNWSDFTKKWDDLNKEDYRLTDIETFESGSKQYFLGVWREGKGAYGLYLFNNWDSSNAKLKEIAPYRLIDLEQIPD